MTFILLISTCKERLHEKEFVDPIEKTVEFYGFKSKVVHYLKLNKKDLDNSDKVIICGTSLKDFDYFNNVEKFSWLKDFYKPVLGICAGMQIIGKVYNQKLKQKTEIGLFKETFKREFLDLLGEKQVWHLHNACVEFDGTWEVFCEGNKIQQAVKHKTKPFCGVLFHPEVRNKEIIGEFLKL